MGDLTDLSASDIVFAEATPEQRQISWELNGMFFASPLSLSDYFAREKLLSQQDLARDGGCRYWVLYPEGRPDRIIASCESFCKPVLIAENGGVRESRGHSVAHIHTNAEYRRQGMAALLMSRLQVQLEQDGECTVLYSDIGKGYYTRLGWTAFPNRLVTLSLLSPYGSTRNRQEPRFEHSEPRRARYLKLEEIPDLCALDGMYLSRRFHNLPPDGFAHIAFLPTSAQVLWHNVREDFMAEKLSKPRPMNRGAIADNGKTWIYWRHDWRAGQLEILRVAQNEGLTIEWRADEIRVLLEAALVEASAHGLSRVVAWNPDEQMTLGSKGVGNRHQKSVKVVVSEQMDKMIPCFRWSGGRRTQKTVWEDNYAYGWC